MSRTIAWDDQRIFLAALEEGSISGAARRLGLSYPTVRSRLEALEDSLGTVLFTRAANGLTPTNRALALRDSAHAMSTASELFLRIATSPPGEAAGVVRLSVSEFVGTEIMPAILQQLRERYPAIRVELSLSNVSANLLTREVDVAVRMIAPKQEALVARKVSSIPLGLYASPSYLVKRGVPEDFQTLSRHDFIGPDRSVSDMTLVRNLIEKLGPDFAEIGFALKTDSHPAQIAAARAGVGIAVVQVPVADRDPELRRILPNFDVATLDAWVVMHENLRKAPAVRAVFDLLVQSFTGNIPH